MAQTNYYITQIGNISKQAGLNLYARARYSVEQRRNYCMQYLPKWCAYNILGYNKNISDKERVSYLGLLYAITSDPERGLERYYIAKEKRNIEKRNNTESYLFSLNNFNEVIKSPIYGPQYPLICAEMELLTANSKLSMEKLDLHFTDEKVEKAINLSKKLFEKDKTETSEK